MGSTPEKRHKKEGAEGLCDGATSFARNVPQVHRVLQANFCSLQETAAAASATRRTASMNVTHGASSGSKRTSRTHFAQLLGIAQRRDSDQTRTQ